MKSGKPRLREQSTELAGQTLFGKWTVERLIGVGGTATVLQARHRNGRRAALKILHPHLAAQGRTRERFLREGRLANLVSHPGVVAVLDDFTTDEGSAVLVLELVQGKTLAAVAKEAGGRLSPVEVANAARAVLDVLAVAHDAGVIHRDIKPENILRCPDGTHKLADFGLAALCHELGMLTGTNTSLGTPAYMSPEQARGDALRIDARTDIWGVGATMFTLMTGQYLHANSAARNLMLAVATEQVPPVLSMAPGMHPPLASLIDRAVRMDKEERWPNARAMLAELRAIEVPDSPVERLGASSLADAASMSTVPHSLSSMSRGAWPKRARTPSDRRRMAAAAGIAIVAVGGALAWLRARADSPPTGNAVNAVLVTGAAHSIGADEVKARPELPPGTQSGASKREAELPSSVGKPALRKARGPTRRSAKSSSSSTPVVAGEARAQELPVPDEVLDRRE